MKNFIGQDILKDIPISDIPFVVDVNIIGYPFSLSDLINQYGKEIIPDCLGIYHLFYYDQLVYVGMSKNLRGRLLCHLRDADMVFHNVLWFCANMWKENATIEDVLRIEHKMIKKYKPVLNSVHANCR
jgi:excinuclease UvrABC nuclease subunit